MTATDTRAFGPYRIVRRLGVGGMAETFLALRRGLHGVEQRVCLKRVLPAFAADPSFLRQFEREATIASTLRFTGIVGVVEFGDVEGAKYLALELVDGVDLRDFLASRPGRVLDPDTVARVALDLGYALRYAHQPGRAVLHRDVSPANVMLSRTGEVKLTDFGVARVMSSAPSTTSTGVRGKIAYMSPEQLRGEELDGRADLFALGVLLFECLCGQRPFHGAHDIEIMRRIAEGERAPVRDLAPRGAPGPLLDAIEGLLATDRALRTPDASALIEQLARVPGLHQARRRLAAEVDALCGGVDTRAHVRSQREERADTRLDSVPAAALEANTPPGPSLPAPVVLTPSVASRPPRAVGRLALALVALGVVLGGGAWVSTRVQPNAALAALGAAQRRTGEEGTLGQAAGAEGTPGQAAGSPAAQGLAAGAGLAPHEGAGPSAEVPALRSALGPVASARATRGAPRLEVTSSSPREGSRPSTMGAAAAAGVASVGTRGDAAPLTAGRTGSASDGRAEGPGAAAARDAAQALASAPASVAGATSAPRGAPEDGEPRTGTVHVTVIPWGYVWVDGRYMGRAPAEVSLRPGRHVVAGGTEGPARRRTVQLSPGQTRRVEIDLEAP